MSASLWLSFWLPISQLIVCGCAPLSVSCDAYLSISWSFAIWLCVCYSVAICLFYLLLWLSVFCLSVSHCQFAAVRVFLETLNFLEECEKTEFVVAEKEKVLPSVFEGSKRLRR
jgi:hypothetical protein